MFQEFLQHNLCNYSFDIDVRPPDNIDLYKQSKKLQEKYDYDIKFSGTYVYSFP